MKATSALLVTAAFTWGCGSDQAADAGGGVAFGPSDAPKFRVVEEGEGAVNEAPLWPMHGGTTMDQLRILGERNVHGRRVMVVVQDGPPSALNWLPPSYYSESDEGILWHGNLRDGFWSRPLLVVPKTIRAGMKWTSDPGAKGPSGSGRPLNCVAATVNANPAATFLQAPKLWSVNCTDGYLANWGDSFIPGLGITPAHHMDVRSGPAYPAEPEAAPSELVPINGGAPIFPKFFAHRVGSILVPGDGAGKRRIVAEGEHWDLLMGGVTNPDGSGISVNVKVPAKTQACAMLEGQQVVEADLNVELDPASDCPAPLGAAIGGDGKLRSIHAGNYCLDNGDRCSTVSFFGIRGDADGAEVLVTSDQLYSARFYDGTDEHAWYRVGDSERSGLKLGNLGLLDANGFWLLFGDKGSPGESLLVPDQLNAHLYAGGWHGRWIDPHPALASAALSASVSEQGRDVLDVTPEGRISRIAVDDGNLTLSLLAQVTPPVGHAVVGAVDDGEQLLVFTQGDYKGWTTQVIPAPLGVDEPPTIDKDIEPDVGNVFAWTVKLAAKPGAPLAPPAERTPIYVEADVRDLRISSPAPLPEPPSDAILGDSAVAFALPTSAHSALLVRDQQGPSPLMPNGWQWLNPFRFEGDLPGVGHAQVAVLFPNANTTWPSIGTAGGALAPLKGGGFVNSTSPFHVWSAGGVLEGPADAGEGGSLLVDGSGNGLWMRGPERMDCVMPSAVASGCLEWTLWGRERRVFHFDDEPASNPAQPMATTAGVVGGGVLTQHYLLRPDGKRHFFSAPAAQLGSTFQAWGATADATVCGNYVENIVTPEGASGTQSSLLCIDAEGGLRSAPAFAGFGYATADGVFYGTDATTGDLVRFDPDTFEVTTLEQVSVTGLPRSAIGFDTFVRDAQGELFSTLSIFPPPTAQTLPSVFHFTRQGVERIDMPSVPDLVLPGKTLLVDESVFLFLGPGGASNGVYRVPR